MATVCPHCQRDNTTEHCEHWICARNGLDIVEFLITAHVAPEYDPMLLQKHHAKYMIEINKYAVAEDVGWFTRTAEADKMKRRLQKSVFALEATSYPVRE